MTNTSNDPNELLTEWEAAQFLKASVRSLQTWRSPKKKSGPRYVKLNRMVRYRRQDLIDWVDSNLR